MASRLILRAKLDNVCSEGWEKLERHELTQELSKVSLRNYDSGVHFAGVLADHTLFSCQWERPAGQRNSNVPGLYCLNS